MKKLFLIRYGEIGLKGQNRRQFEDILQRNIKQAIVNTHNHTGAQISKSYGRFYVSGIEADEEEAYLDKLSRVPGIVAVNPAFAVENDLSKIKQTAILAIKQAIEQIAFSQSQSLSEAVTFKVDTRRADKSFPLKSPEVNQEIGAAILRNVPGLTVDVHNPDIHLAIEIRKQGTYVYWNQKRGPGGLPVGSSGKGILLISGGIDSPVAGYMAMKRGVAIDALHFWSYPITGERARDKVVDICRVLRQYNPRLRLFIAPFTKIQTEIMEKCPEKYRVTIMRRMMMRVASEVCRKLGGMAIFTGESLGQVASQTLQSLQVIEEAAGFPVLRPLICFDKIETIQMAEEIGTYDISCLPYEDCCSVFVPKHPVTKPRLNETVKAEKHLDIEKLTEECATNIEQMDIE